MMKTACLLIALISSSPALAENMNLAFEAEAKGKMSISNEIILGSTGASSDALIFDGDKPFTRNSGFCFLTYVTGMLNNIGDYAYVTLSHANQQWHFIVDSNGSREGLNAGIRCIRY